MDAILVWYTVCYNRGVNVSWLETEAVSLSGIICLRA